jgi:hypothetical protein
MDVAIPANSVNPNAIHTSIILFFVYGPTSDYKVSGYLRYAPWSRCPGAATCSRIPVITERLILSFHFKFGMLVKTNVDKKTSGFISPFPYIMSFAQDILNERTPDVVSVTLSTTSADSNPQWTGTARACHSAGVPVFPFRARVATGAGTPGVMPFPMRS